MNHSLATRLIDYCSLVNSPHGDDRETTLIKSDEIIASLKNKASDFTFPKLEALVSKESCLHNVVVRDVHNSQIEGVDVNGFVSDH
tara:strand:+ start:1131 stop:1388 length:258 start_codon:yes stop_codon:yes gene_type:complete